MLHSPRHPIDDVGVDIIIARSQHFEDVLAQYIPIATPRRNAPSATEVELAVDDMLATRLEDDAGILQPIFVREPELADIGKLAVRRDVTIEIEVAEVFEAQERRHAV